MLTKIPEHYSARSEVFKLAGVRPRYSWEAFSLDMRPLTDEKLEELVAIGARTKDEKGGRTLHRDAKAYLGIRRGGTAVKAKNTKGLVALLDEFFRQRDPADGGRWVIDRASDPALVWWVYKSEYEPPGDDSPSYCVLHLAALARDKVVTTTRRIQGIDCRKSALEALDHMKLVLMDELAFEAYEDDASKFAELCDRDMVGTVVMADGMGARIREKDHNSWRWYWGRERQPLATDEGPAKMVIDVRPKDSEGGFSYGWSSSRTGAVNIHRWESRLTPKEIEAGEDGDAPEATGRTRDDVLPVHPFLVAFCLRRHQMFEVYAGDLELYEYDRSMADKLVLPQETTDLIRVLVTTDTGYQDIVSGKGGGTVILSAGPPGVGKTLTAEVYAETIGVPLYSVQCAQLGTDPDSLEKNLAAALSRAERWGAVCLLDEADVYIAKRGSDVKQNAIVGVFLRLLERYDGTLFLTTNRGDTVDDAIASRCIARVDYAPPPSGDLERIWRILSDAAGAGLGTEEIRRIVKTHPGLTGRDVKNLLKLGMAVAKASGQPVDCDVITFVRRFKPTGAGEDAPTTEWRPPARAASGALPPRRPRKEAE